MLLKTSEANPTRKFPVYLAVVLGVLLLVSLSMAQELEDAGEDEVIDIEAAIFKSCNFGASGDGCVFDVTATGSGMLEVDTRASRTSNRWRTIIVEVGQNPAVSNIGTGSTTAFTGLVTQAVVSGRKYEVIVIHERLTSGTFPAGVEVRFNGPVTVSGPRPRSGGGDGALPGLYGGVYSPFAGHRDFFSLETSPDGTHVTRIALSSLLCGAFIHVHSFSLSVNIPIINRRFVARTPVVTGGHSHTLTIDGIFFDADGFGGTPEQALGGFSFLDSSNTCNHQWRATTVADRDRDGWSDAAEQRLGSRPDLGWTPEHKLVPTTPLYGPDPCHDFDDNDGDGRVDGADSGCR
jgi:hypothetical protein